MRASVCPFICRMPRPNSTTERLRKPKISTVEVHHKIDPWTYLKVKRSTVKVTRQINAVVDNARFAGSTDFTSTDLVLAKGKSKCIVVI